MTRHPTIEEQIAAIERAIEVYAEARRELDEMGLGRAAARFADAHCDALAAAVETLKTLEFTREVLT